MTAWTTPTFGQFPLQIRSYFISPAEYQLVAAVDSANKYHQLYINQLVISEKYKRADQISQGQYLKADSAYRNQVKTTIVVIGERDTEKERADQAEGKVNEYLGRQPKTWVGKQLQRVGTTTKNVVTVVGAVAVVAITLNLVIP